MNINIETGVCGLFQLETFRCDESGVEIPGSRKVKAPWFQNLITDAGLNRMGANNGWKGYCQVGSGATSPAVTDTGLVSRIAGVSVEKFTAGSSGSAPWYGFSRTVTRFPAGVAAGNLAEVGMGWSPTGNLFSRALILDAGGSPTTITVLPDEFLDVTYEFRQYAPTVDGTGTVVLAGVTYNYTSRASTANSSSWQATASGVQMGVGGGGIQPVLAYTGDIGAVTGSPSGTSTSMPGSIQAYVNNSLTSKTLISAGPTQGNLTGGIGSIQLQSTSSGNGAFQIGFSPKIPKDATKTLNLAVSYSWARKTL